MQKGLRNSLYSGLLVITGLLIFPIAYTIGETTDCRDIPGARCPDLIIGETTDPETVTDTPNQTSIRNTLIASLPKGEPVACEHEWTIRHLYYQPDSILPRRMYFAACNQDTDRPSLFVSLSLGKVIKAKNDAYSGALIKSHKTLVVGVIHVIVAEG